MIPSEEPPNEAERLSSLRRMELLSTSREADLDRITRLAKHILDADISVISLLDEKRQWFKARSGIDVAETPRSISFCGHTILQDAVFIVPDATEDVRFCDNPLVIAPPNIRAYAGVPLTNLDGFRIGTLCSISASPRSYSSDQIDLLMDLGKLAETVLAHRELSSTQGQLIQSLETAERDRLLDPLTGLWNRRAGEQILDREFCKVREQGALLGLAVLDLDRFKAINDLHGHATGDVVINLAAEIVVQEIGDKGIAWRFGGEEFVAVFPGASEEGMRNLCERILSAFHEKARFRAGHEWLSFTTSVGGAVATAEMRSGLDLFVAADTALRKAKEAGRDRFQVA